MIILRRLICHSDQALYRLRLRTYSKRGDERQCNRIEVEGLAGGQDQDVNDGLKRRRDQVLVGKRKRRLDMVICEFIECAFCRMTEAGEYFATLWHLNRCNEPQGPILSVRTFIHQQAP